MEQLILAMLQTQWAQTNSLFGLKEIADDEKLSKLLLKYRYCNESLQVEMHKRRDSK